MECVGYSKKSMILDYWWQYTPYVILLLSLSLSWGHCWIFLSFFFLICSPQHTKPASAPPHRATGNNSITRQPMVRSNRRLNLLGAQDPVHAAMPIFSVSNHLIFILLPNVPVLQTPPVQLVNRLCHGRLCVMVDCGIDPAKRGQGWANKK